MELLLFSIILIVYLAVGFIVSGDPDLMIVSGISDCGNFICSTVVVL